MIRTIFSRTDIFLLFVIFITFLSSLILTICKCIKKAIFNICPSNNPSNSFFWKNTIININLPTKVTIQNPSKIATQQSQNQSSPTSSQDNQTPPSTTQNPQTSTRNFLFKTIHTLLKNDMLVIRTTRTSSTTSTFKRTNI